VLTALGPARSLVNFRDQEWSAFVIAFTFPANFVPIVNGYDMIAALGDAETAVLVYDLHTVPVTSSLVCECFTVADGRITQNRLIFDQTPYAARQP
jgi:hypothetical protein